jgi:CRP/FNR family transcriptional regulator, anaerobic regulatory protein
MIFSQPELLDEFKRFAHREHLTEGASLLEPGQYVQIVPIVITGCLRVIRQNESGEEVFLYHLMPGETCALSLTCCATHKPSEIKIVAEEDTDYWAVPLSKVEQWQLYKEWKAFIALTYQTRFNTMLKVIDDIAFKQMDQRLWAYLQARAQAKNTNTLHISHEDIANELNMQREAASRLIKKLKENGFIETSRNEIRLIK